jgi:hypothetical protein
MSIGAISGNAAQSQAASDAERQIAVLKKGRDVEKAAADALIEVVKQAATPQGSGRIDTYA